MDHHDISLEIVYFNSLTIVTVKVPVIVSFIDMVIRKSNFEMLKIFYPMNRFLWQCLAKRLEILGSQCSTSYFYFAFITFFLIERHILVYCGRNARLVYKISNLVYIMSLSNTNAVY